MLRLKERLLRRPLERLLREEQLKPLLLLRPSKRQLLRKLRDRLKRLREKQLQLRLLLLLSRKKLK